MLLKGLDHVVHGGGRGAKETLHIALGRGLAMDGGVSIDERQVLALPVGPWRGVVIGGGRRHEGVMPLDGYGGYYP